MASKLTKVGNDLHIADGGSTYVLNGTKLEKLVQSGTNTPVKAAEAKNIVFRTVRHLEDNAVSGDVLDMLKTDAVAEGFKELNTDKDIIKRINKLQKAAEIAGEIKSKTAGITAGNAIADDLQKELRSLIVRGGDKSLNLLETSTHEILDGLNQKELRKVQAAYDALHDAASETGATKQSINAVARKHRESVAEAMEILGKAEDRTFFTTINKAIDGSIKDVPADVLEKISKRTEKIKTNVGEQEKAFKALRDAEAVKRPKVSDIDAAQEAVTKLEKDFIKLTEDGTGKSAVKDMLKDPQTKTFFDKIKGNSSVISDHLEAIKKTTKDVAETAGKAGAAVKSGAWWEKDVKALEELAKKEGKASYKELGTIARMNTGSKVLALGTVAAAVYAAIGRPGKAAQQNQEQQAALMQQQQEGQVAAR